MASSGPNEANDANCNGANGQKLKLRFKFAGQTTSHTFTMPETEPEEDDAASSAGTTDPPSSRKNGTTKRKRDNGDQNDSPPSKHAKGDTNDDDPPAKRSITSRRRHKVPPRALEEPKREPSPRPQGANRQRASALRSKRERERDEDSEEEDDDEKPQPRRLTTRQKAMLNEGSEKIELLSLPMESVKKKIPLSEEAQLKKAEMAVRRKLELQRQTEEEKAQTVKKLLTKGPVTKQKQKKDEAGRRTIQLFADGQAIRYASTPKGSFLVVPSTQVLPILSAANERDPASRRQDHIQTCAAPGCMRPRRYLGARTLKPLCSLECYQLLENTCAAAKQKG